MTLNWWIAQSFAVASIYFAFSAMQQKTTTDILLHRSTYALLVFAGSVFLGIASAMIMLGVAFVRNMILLLLSFRDVRVLKYVAFVILAISLITLNLIFWQSHLSILCIADGLIYLTAFIQSRPVNVRRICMVGSVTSITFFILIFSPVNIFISLAMLISSIIGLIRIDKKKAIAFFGGGYRI